MVSTNVHPLNHGRLSSTRYWPMDGPWGFYPWERCLEKSEPKIFGPKWWWVNDGDFQPMASESAVQKSPLKKTIPRKSWWSFPKNHGLSLKVPKTIRTKTVTLWKMVIFISNLISSYGWSPTPKIHHSKSHQPGTPKANFQIITTWKIQGGHHHFHPFSKMLGFGVSCAYYLKRIYKSTKMKLLRSN